MKKKKSKGGQKLRLWVPPCVFIYENAIELWVLKTENSLWLFSVSITHNSKIREFSDGNRVMETELSFGQTTFLLWVLPFLSYELWKLRIELWKHLVQTTPKYRERITSCESPSSRPIRWRANKRGKKLICRAHHIFKHAVIVFPPNAPYQT